jgi:AcrR family transcriptional regulator
MLGPVSSRKEQAEQSRTRLIDTALRLFVDQGYEATPVSQILDEAGMARGALYHHFPDGKKELFAEVVDVADHDLHEGLERIVAEVASPVERIAAASRLVLDLAADRTFGRIVLVEAAAVMPGAWSGGGEYVLLRATLEEAMAAGEVREMPLDAATSVLFGAIRRMADVVAVADDPAAAARDGIEVIEAVLAGLRA